MFKKVLVTTLSTAILAGGALAGTANAAPAQPTKEEAQTQVVQVVKSGSFSSIEDLNKWVNDYLSAYNIHINVDSLLAKYNVQQPAQQNVQTPAPAQAQPQPQQQEEAKAPVANKEEQKAAPQKEEKAAEPATEQKAQAPAQKQETAADSKQTEDKKATEGLSAFEQQVVDLTNKEREKAGLKPLKADTELSKVARAKSKDMADNGYFDHNSPTYGSPFDMMKSFGISYKTAGENIAQGQKTPEEVVEAWMNSQGHRENILNADYTNIGVGYVENGNYWTQQFIGK
ncbi:CAP domain-containing protein [Terribacillus saccharophilus]|uniref:CAP domain-containing protein n=1 Tax=Terribacillus saccharophilus TaxID=361277 RepID=UPI003981A158